MEATVKNDIKAVLDALPRCFYFMPVPGAISKYGISDFIGLYQGKFFAIEAKATPKQTATMAQRIFLAAVRRAGGLACVINCDNVHTLKARLETHAANT